MKYRVQWAVTTARSGKMRPTLPPGAPCSRAGCPPLFFPVVFEAGQQVVGAHTGQSTRAERKFGKPLWRLLVILFSAYAMVTLFVFFFILSFAFLVNHEMP